MGVAASKAGRDIQTSHHANSTRKVLYTLFYVLPFYLSSTTRPSRTLSRDAPSVIRARITSVSLTCVLCSVATFVIITSHGQATNADALHSMGYWPIGLAESAKALLLTAILFVGPLYETFIVYGAWRDWMSLQPITELFNEWTTWRNIIAVSKPPSFPRAEPNSSCQIIMRPLSRVT